MALARMGSLRARKLVRGLLLAALLFSVMYFMPLQDIRSKALQFLDFDLPDAVPTVDIIRHINPLIGTVNGGHVFAGPTLPYGMAKPCPDAMSPDENAAGFVSDYSPILGFSQLHDSGTGGSASMGNFPLFAHPGCPGDDWKRCNYTMSERMLPRVNGSVVSTAGYMAINLTNSVRTEMTAAMKTSLFRFTFSPEQNISYYREISNSTVTTASNPVIQIEINDLSSTRYHGGVQVYPGSGRIIGDGTFSPSFGVGEYRAYFCADFKGAKILNTGVFEGWHAFGHRQYLQEIARGYQNPSNAGGAWIHFEHPENHQILARVGMSFISVDQACENAEADIPDFDFDRTVQAAQDAWRTKFSAVEVDATGVSEDLQQVFWSGLYRSFLSPQNYTGENPLWNSTEPYFDSFYCIWDSFRAQHPLISLVDPAAQAEMVRTLLDVYRFVGKLPDCRMQFSKGYTQGGSNADVVIVDTYLKNITEGIDWETAYDAVIDDAEIPPVDFSLEGRGNYESWVEYGYIAKDHYATLGGGPHSRTVSRTVEYAYDDFCIAMFAKDLGYDLDHEVYLNRSGNWKNLWNPEQQDLYHDEDGDLRRSEFKGFLMPRNMNGSFVFQPVRQCSPVDEPHHCYFDTSLATYEGSPWLYSFYAPHDMAGLIGVYGGRDKFIERLTFYHSSGIAYMGNEQSFLTVFQFHYGGRPGLSSYWVNQYIPSQFNNSINGIPGNDDCAMGAFSSFAMMGFFPVSGQPVYLLSTPFFNEVKVRSRGKMPAVIRKVGGEGIYIQNATLNGIPYTKNWISHEFFLRGGLLELTIGKTESKWGTRDEDLPPSYPPL